MIFIFRWLLDHLRPTELGGRLRGWTKCRGARASSRGCAQPGSAPAWSGDSGGALLVCKGREPGAHIQGRALGGDRPGTRGAPLARAALAVPAPHTRMHAHTCAHMYTHTRAHTHSCTHALHSPGLLAQHLLPSTPRWGVCAWLGALLCPTGLLTPGTHWCLREHHPRVPWAPPLGLEQREAFGDREVTLGQEFGGSQA